MLTTVASLLTAAGLVAAPVALPSAARAESNGSGSIQAVSLRARPGDAYPVTIGCTDPTVTGYDLRFDDGSTPTRAAGAVVRTGQPFSGLSTTYAVPGDAAVGRTAALHLECRDAAGTLLTSVEVDVTIAAPAPRAVVVMAPAELRPGTFDVAFTGCAGEPDETPVRLAVLLDEVGHPVAGATTTLGALGAGPTTGSRVFAGVGYLAGGTAVDQTVVPAVPVADGAALRVVVTCSAGASVTDTGQTEAVYRTAALVTAPPAVAPAPTAPVAAQPTVVTAPVLPFTGGTPVGALLALGAGLVGLGAGLVRAGRRRPAPTAS